MNNRILEERLQALTEKLDALTIKQDNINEQVLHTRRKVETVTKQIKNKSRKKTTTDTGRKRIIAVAGSGLHLGDYVHIRNPSKNQERQGEIIRVTRDGLLKIRTPLRNIIRRLPKNVWLVNGH